MNNQSIQLLSILANCNPQDKQLNSELKIQSIIKSEDYLELANRSLFADIFNNLFNENKLRTYEEYELNKVIQVIPLIPECLDNIVFSLKSGDCSRLTSADKPDFLDVSSIIKLTRRFEQGGEKNYCNIAPEEYMEIFSDETIKSIRPYFDQLPYGCQDYNTAINELLSPKKYCIKESEINSLLQDLSTKTLEIQNSLEEAKMNNTRISMLKLLVCMICVALPTLYGTSTGNLSESMTTVSTTAAFILSCIYYFKGDKLI